VNPAALELLSARLAKDRLQVVLRIGKEFEAREDEPKIWGIVLADIARHVARGLADRYDLDESRVLDSVRYSFLDELEHPTSTLRSEQ
jgi:hypothetical protein